jgi:hypothetical protein
MPHVVELAGVVLGFGVGLHFARLLAAVIRDSSGAQQMLAAYKEIFGYCLGGIVGSAAFGYVKSAEAGTYYVLGYGLGSVVAYFWPLLPSRYTLESVHTVVVMSDAFEESTPDQEARSLLILNTLVSPKAIQRSEKITETQLADRLEKATDSVASHASADDPAPSSKKSTDG